MCGIIGYVGSQETEPLLIEALKRLEYRGYDSCGIAILDNGSSRRVRALGRIARLEEIVYGGDGGRGNGKDGVHGNGGNGASGNGDRRARRNGGPGARAHDAADSPQHDIDSSAALEDVEVISLPSRLRIGIGHTRWATHGRPSETNAHPHSDCSGAFLVAHNGIIENYGELKRQLAAEGHRFCTETDTEVLPHLVEKHFQGNLEEAVRAALAEVDGMYGCVFISAHDNGKIVAARQGAPLVIGIGDNENFIASDAPAVLQHTRDLIFLEDGEIAIVRSDGVEILRRDGSRVERQPQRVDWSAEMAEKQGYPHFMLKEIHEQPRALHDTLGGRVRRDGRLTLDPEATAALDRIEHIERLHIVACGTSLHAGLIGRRLIEGLARLPVEVEYASEFRYREPLIDQACLVVGVSQSGETADTLAALHEARRRGATLFAICNVLGSTITRECEGVLYTNAGPEIGVASTKAFVTQLAAFHVLALELARRRGTLDEQEVRHRALQLRSVPELIERILEQNATIEAAAARLSEYDNCLYLGRGISHPIAMEGALKLKEIAYIHAEGYPAGEMKHGPIALIDDDMGVVVVAPRDGVYRKTLSNIEESKVRDGRVLAIATEGDDEIAALADDTIFVPEADVSLTPFLTVVPLQLLAYHAGVLRGCDVDKPRNLAKSVTVE